MATGTEQEPIIINTDFVRSVGRHFWNVVTHPMATPSLYPDLGSFLEEITPTLLEKLGSDSYMYFEFSSDPNGCTFKLTRDSQTEDFYIQRVVPSTPNAPMTRLPKVRTIASILEEKLGIDKLKQGLRQAKKTWDNPFTFFPDSNSDK
jgi:hypothetical protein